MKLILTISQANLVLTALEWAEDPNGSYTDNAHWIRIENKIRKALGEQAIKPTTKEERKDWKELEQMKFTLTQDEFIERTKELNAKYDR